MKLTTAVKNRIDITIPVNTVLVVSFYDEDFCDKSDKYISISNVDGKTIETVRRFNDNDSTLSVDIIDC